MTCPSTIVFGDDHGDNDCTFHCKLEKGHFGWHTENGKQEGQTYLLQWEDPKGATRDR